MNKERITCRDYCIKWDSIDKDCEIYGQQHPCPRKCYWYLKDKLANNKIQANTVACNKIQENK